MKRTTMMVALLGCLMLGACGSAPRATGPQIEQLSRMAYPGQAAHGPDLDVVVIRRGSTIELVNRSPATFSGAHLWLNQQFVGIIDLNIGAGNRYSLHQFVNEHGETYPTGSFLAPDKSFPIILAELLDPATGLRHRLLVRLPRS